MTRVHSFPPLENPGSRLLVLGTMPGIASLRAQQYYAHPQNLFWEILADSLGFDPTHDYATRTAHVMSAGVAVWDVLMNCVREGSLDSDIDEATAVPNDFAGFFATHPQIRRVCFNGAKAEALFGRHVRPHLTLDVSIEFLRLPSTSPANASIPVMEKMLAWKNGLNSL